jgi:hypothetical protein
VDRPQLVAFWKVFFADLFLGTFKRLVLFGVLGAALGAGVLAMFKVNALDPRDLASWADAGVLALVLFWFTGFGFLGGLVAAVLTTGSRKLRQATGGINDLLDLLSHQVLSRFPKVCRDIPRRKLEKEFDQLGQEFQNQLKLKKSLKGAFAALLFGWVIKTLKFFFLDDVMGELRGKPAESVSSSDIESAVRRVGVEKLMEPVTDFFLLFQTLNCALMTLLFAIPFGLFWLL